MAIFFVSHPGNLQAMTAYKVVEELAPRFQVIITDHANINEEWFHNSIVER
jgi:hypothetical protein